jgi:hypothetical protein
MKCPFLMAIALTSLAIVTPGYGEGIFGGGNTLNPSFCKAHNIRQTVVYVDDSILVGGQHGWLLTIYNKLTATLVPGERTTLVELSPTTGQSTERWSGCWPAYTPADTARLTGENYIFSTSPLSTVKEQQGFFGRDLGVAVANIEKAIPDVGSHAIDPANPPQKSIIRALASDGARFAHTQETIRAILYSDLAENSDLGSVFKPTNAPANYGTKLGTYLRRSVFYVFGVGTNIRGNGSVQDTIRAFWDDAFRSMAASVGGIGTDLNVPNVVPVAAYNYDLLLKDGNQTLVGRLSLLTDSDGTLVDSWLGIIRLRNASINGTYRCTGTEDLPSCMFQGTTAGGVVTLSPSEVVSLSSHESTALTGNIGVPGSNVNLPLAATPAAD